MHSLARSDVKVTEDKDQHSTAPNGAARSPHRAPRRC